MKMTDNEPNWHSEAPWKARQAIIVAAEFASYGRGDAAMYHLFESDVSERWLCIVSVRTLAALAAGPHAAELWAKLRADAHALASETNADDRRVRMSLVAIAMAEAFERGQLGRCAQLATNSEFRDVSLAYAAALLVGDLVFLLAGPQTSKFFARLRYRNGLVAS